MNLFDFKSVGDESGWIPVDDRVMGGVSRSEMIAGSGFASFKGIVSPENNGGFCSVRARLKASMAPEVEHIWIDSRSNGQVYSLSFRTNRTIDGISYQADFIPTTEFTRIELPLIDFKAQYRGRAVIGAPSLSSNDIQQIGIVISDTQYGEFQLDIRGIGAD